MATRVDPKAEARRHLADEIGTLTIDAPESVALVYPSPYNAAMSSLGYQTIYRRINGVKGRCAHRAFLPEDVEAFQAARMPLFTYEGMRPVSDYRVMAMSVAYELELAGVVQVLELSNMPVFAEDRDERHPFVIAGGPLTFSNPLPLAPYVDAILMGEADETTNRALDVIFGCRTKHEAMRELARLIPTAFVPAIHGSHMPPVEKAPDEFIPAYSQIVTPNTELRSMFLIEPERGCHRGCTYCVMRRSTNDGMRTVPMETVLSLIPEHARRVGLVGAATTDHPQISEIVERIADGGREVGLSSLRADRLNDRFMAALRRGGQTALTTASDGPSQRLRDFIQRKNNTDVLFRAASLAQKHGFKRMKLYMMIGLPTENEDDMNELVEFSLACAKIVPLALGIAPFVAKRNTPLDGEAFAGIPVVEKRLEMLRKKLRGKVDLRSTSARWAHIEYVLAQGGAPEGRAVRDAVHAGGSYRAWKNAFDALPADRPRRELVKPGNKLGRAPLLPVLD